MKKYLYVVFLVIFNLPVYAANMATALNAIEQEWATLYYGRKNPEPSAIYQKLLADAKSLARDFPSHAEPLLWQAILIATDADHQTPLKALEHISAARDILLHALAIDANGVEGAAQVALGTLYYMAPPWPIAFGDNEEAEKNFISALKINPNSIEANYFYGDFLLSQNKPTAAIAYFKKALTIPPRRHQLYADESLQRQAALSLKNINAQPLGHSKKILLSRLGDLKNPE